MLLSKCWLYQPVPRRHDHDALAREPVVSAPRDALRGAGYPLRVPGALVLEGCDDALGAVLDDRDRGWPLVRLHDRDERVSAPHRASGRDPPVPPPSVGAPGLARLGAPGVDLDGG